MKLQFSINNGSETEYSVRSLKIDSTLDLSTQIVSLISPIDNYSTLDTSITFKWSALYNANEYHFQLLDYSSSSILLDSIITNELLLL